MAWSRLRQQNASVLARFRRELKDILRMEDDRAVKRAARNTQEPEAVLLPKKEVEP